MKRIFQILTVLLSLMLSLTFTSTIHKSFSQEELLSQIQNSSGSKQNEPRWNPNADLDKDGIVNLRDLVIYGVKKPLILNVSTYYISTFYEGYSVHVIHADKCVLSYMFSSPGNSPSNWKNQTMTRKGNDFNGTLCLLDFPYVCTINVKIYAINFRGFSTEANVTSISGWDDP